MKSVMLVPILMASLAFAHEEKLDDIEVSTHDETQGLVDFVPSVTKLKGHELIKKRQTSIGDMLSGEAGVQSTSFGPNSSRPIIRGLDGDRIRILQNSLGTMDASTQSLDHAIPVDTLTIDQMEIIRGPMSLLYGSSAVGGVVNLVTNRIHYSYEEGFFAKFLTQGETVNNGLSNALHMNYGANKWMFHVDGSTRNLGNQEIPRYARSSKLRQQDPSIEEEKDKLPNSFNKQDNVAVAVSRIMDRGYVGASFNHYNTYYGSVADDEVTIDMTQNRFEVHGEYRQESNSLQNRFEVHGEYRPESNSLRKVKFKTAISDYFHKELEDGATGTVFKNEGHESRLELLNKTNNWDGVTGIHTQFFKFGAKGEEAFLPESDNSKVALFTFQQLTHGKNAYRFGGRLENSVLEKKSSANFGSSDEKNYLGMNVSLGHCYDFSRKNTLESSVSYSERAPNFQELYAEGDHIATSTFETGDSTLIKEKATAIEVTYKNTSDRNQLTASVYTQVFKDYISLNPTGAISTGEGFDVYQYEQVDALFYGLDIDNRTEIKKLSQGALYLIGKFDFVRAKDTDSGKNLPRISPPRVTLGLEYNSDQWSADIEHQYVSQQTKTADFETRTDAYNLTNIGYTYHIVDNLTSLDIFARVRNIFDTEARSHVSTLKDISPLPGRNFIAGVQLQF